MALTRRGTQRFILAFLGLAFLVSAFGIYVIQAGRTDPELQETLQQIRESIFPDPLNIERTPSQEYVDIALKLRAFIEYEMHDKDIPSFAISLLDGPSIVWARGFGPAQPENRRPMTPATVFRTASISKLFTNLAIMQNVEAGVLDLDVPITTYLPDFQPENPFDKPITLRQLMTHRSGLVREPPVGNYFDPTEPTLAEMVESLNQTRLVYEPETRVKYSNAGVSVLGHVLAKVHDEDFNTYIQRSLLNPLGLRKSSFVPHPDLTKDLADGWMWGYDGRAFPAPVFELGIGPAANLYTTTDDLCLFLKALFNNYHETAETPFVSRETLAEMWTIQFRGPDQTAGYGLGFGVSEFEGQLRIAHGGVMYGYASRLYGLPEAQLGVAAFSTVDATNPVVDRIANYALSLMLAQKAGQPLPDPPKSTVIPPEEVSQILGFYRNGNTVLEIKERGGQAIFFDGVTENVLKKQGTTFIVDGRVAAGRMLNIANGQLTMNGRNYERFSVTTPPPAAPEHWQSLIGEYGWDHNTLYILERFGQLYALIEWFFYYPLTEIEPDVFAFPTYGLYHGENLYFQRNEQGKVISVEAASIVWNRRDVAPEDDATFRIKPLRPVEALRAEALAATPPPETGDFRSPDLVEIQPLDATVRLDVRYATTNNFMSNVFYQQARVFLQRPATEALLRVHNQLKAHGLGLWLFDGYRPWYVTKMFWDATPPNQKDFVASPLSGSRHNRGCAIDLTIYDLASGEPVDMVGGYDEFSDRSRADYPGGTTRQRWYRDLLRHAMEAEGFSVYPFEWWHFDYQDWRAYPIMNTRFEDFEQQD